MYTTSLLTTLLAAPLALAAPSLYLMPRAPTDNVMCPIVLDGRVPRNFSTTPTVFDSTNAIFNADFVKGNNLTWSQILKFPAVGCSRFDGAAHSAVEVTISDASIFQKQLGFRRAGLQFAADSAQDASDEGIKTLHFSVKQDPTRPLNLTHEYLNVWHEAADFSNNQIQFQAGTLIDNPSSKKDNFKILDRAGKQIWDTPIDYKQWQNFAITLDYAKNETTVYYSAGTAALARVAGPTSINLAGGGQFQMGVLKKPTGTSDVVNAGFQSPNLNEGLIYGGLFVEDSANGCISL
ncbi:glycoside hydrolase family 131 protein [Didymella exigua CBS 183.55]|uniref:Glycoside hydrolase family 131 protein n=1 Tax=Didymella exigua CBS 183.55 TaxID=1150837 RepID=A0A6A5RGU2_9PLEO|nr:glycoside hydrolase family 131 protein [Didymella exigua CBS 183.55]KAF1927535.1 glycoside hydrolase family 131 protein [Didymella exigua CBS 183.55]